MNAMTVFGIIGAVFSVVCIVFAFKAFKSTKKVEPKNYIDFQDIRGKRVAILHMAKIVDSGDDETILRAFGEAITRLYNDETIDPSDFMIAWTAYNEFRDSVENGVDAP